MDNDLFILGAGGHSRVVIEIALNSGINISGIYDDNDNFYEKDYSFCRFHIAIRHPCSNLSQAINWSQYRTSECGYDLHHSDLYR